jgi:hypothetical protein
MQQPAQVQRSRGRRLIFSLPLGMPPLRPALACGGRPLPCVSPHVAPALSYQTAPTADQASSTFAPLTPSCPPADQLIDKLEVEVAAEEIVGTVAPSMPRGARCLRS